MCVKLKIENLRLSFPKLAEKDDMTGKYQADLVDEDGGKFDELKKLVDAEMEKLKVKKLRHAVIKDGNEKDLEKYPNYKDKMFITAKSGYQPKFYEKVDGKFIKLTDGEKILEHFYGGCYVTVEVSVNKWVHQTSGGKGVSVYLNQMFRSAEGTPFGTGGSCAFGEESQAENPEEFPQ